jgi:hypothetical protein
MAASSLHKDNAKIDNKETSTRVVATFQYSELVAMQRLPLATTPPGDLLQEFMALW